MPKLSSVSGIEILLNTRATCEMRAARARTPVHIMREKKHTPIDTPDRILAGLLRTLWNRRQYRTHLVQQIEAELNTPGLTRGQRAYREKRKHEIETEISTIEEQARTLRRLNQVPIRLADDKERVLSYSLEDISELAESEKL